MLFDPLKRRDFIRLLGGAAAAWPLAARAQQAGGMRRIGVLTAFADNDAEAQANITAFRQSLEKVGWIEGRNLAIDYRWGRCRSRAQTELCDHMMG
jgi:putative tryptophan/tyrosine transport system substrate-binding protein